MAVSPGSLPSTATDYVPAMSPSQPSETELLRYRMKVIRQRMHRRAGAIRSDAKRLLDWRSYLENWPIIGLVASGVIGFRLIPGRKVTQVVKLDEHSIEDLIRRGGVKIQAPPPKRKSWLSGLVAMAGDMALKLAIAQLTRELVQSDVSSTVAKVAARPKTQPVPRSFE